MKRAILASLFAVFISGCLPMGYGGVHAEGKIRDQAGIPIDGALIEF